MTILPKNITILPQSKLGQDPSVGGQALLYFCAFSIFFMIAFPKGGLKIGELPLTIGYVLTIPLFAVAVFSLGKNTYSLPRAICFVLSISLFALSLTSYILYGSQSLNYTIAFFISVLYIPLFCLLFFSDGILRNWNISFETAFMWAIRFVTAYAIALFIYKYLTGSWIEIPYLTVNAADVGQLDEKHINRNGIYKAISTYNNGNIFGICMLIMMPLYNRIEARLIFKVIFVLALILTLSRTIWIGLLIAIPLIAISNGVKLVQAAYIIFALLFVGVMIYFVMILLGADSGFLVDRELGGRLYQFSFLTDATLMPGQRAIDLPEIVYLGIIYNYGYSGLMLFLLALLAPIWAIKSLGVEFFTKRRSSACMHGMVIYLIVAMSDAAFNYIPTMLIFWMIGAWGIWYAEPSANPVMKSLVA